MLLHPAKLFLLKLLNAFQIEVHAREKFWVRNTILYASPSSSGPGPALSASNFSSTFNPAQPGTGHCAVTPFIAIGLHKCGKSCIRTGRRVCRAGRDIVVCQRLKSIFIRGQNEPP